MNRNTTSTSPDNVRKATWSDWLMRRVHYLSADLQRYHLTPSGLIPNGSDQLQRCLVLVLSRKCYQETTDTYPIASYAELQKILRQRDEQGTHYYFIGPLQEGHRKVVTITLNEQAAACSQGAIWVFPISLLCATALPKQLYDVITPDGRFFLLANNTHQWQSVIASTLIADADKALLMLGGPPQTAINELSGVRLVASLNSAWRKLKPAYWLAALAIEPTSQTKFRWKPLLLSIAGLATLYLLLSSLYLNQQYQQRQHTLAAYNNQLDQVLSSRQQLDQTEQLVATLSERLNKPEQSTAVWSTIAFLQQQNVRITSLQTDMQQITLQGDADSATTVLQQLLQFNFIRDASFSAPVRSAQGNRELFTIVMSLNSSAFKTAVTPADADSE